jgi:preprotein translocase subunit SecF
MHYIIESFIIIIILGILVGTALGILVGTGMMLCCMADREKDDAEQLKWIHQLSEEKKK